MMVTSEVVAEARARVSLYVSCHACALRRALRAIRRVHLPEQQAIISDPRASGPEGYRSVA